MSFRLTQDVTVRLSEASPVTGGLIFALDGSPPRTGTSRKHEAFGGRARRRS